MGAAASVTTDQGIEGEEEVHHLGIRLSHISHLIQASGGRDLYLTHRLCDVYTHLVQPVIGVDEERMSYVSYLARQRHPAVATATHFLLYSPYQHFLDIIDSLLTHYHAQLDDIVLWIDILSLSKVEFRQFYLTTSLLNSATLTQTIVCMPSWNLLHIDPSSTAGTVQVNSTSNSALRSYASISTILIQLYLNLQQSHQVDLCFPQESMKDFEQQMMNNADFHMLLQSELIQHLSIQDVAEDTPEEVLKEALPWMEKIDASVGIAACDDLLRKILTLAYVNLLLPHPSGQLPKDFLLPPPSVQESTMPPTSPRLPSTADAKPHSAAGTTSTSSSPQSELCFKNNLAHLLISIGQTEHGKDLLQYCYDQQRRNGSEANIPQILHSMQELADVYMLLEDFASAKSLHEELLQLCTKQFTEQSVEFVSSLQQIASSYLQHDVVHEGFPYAQRAWNLAIDSFGYLHSISLESIKLLLNYYVVKEDYSAMRRLYEDIEAKLHQSNRNQASEDQATEQSQMEIRLKYYNIFGMFAFQTQEIDLAKLISEQCLTMTKEFYGDHHVNTWNAMNNAMSLLTNIQDFDGAELMAENMVQSKLQALGPQAESSLSSKITLANFYLIRNKHEKAKVLFEELVVDCEQVFGLEHPETMDVRKHLESLST